MFLAIDNFKAPALEGHIIWARIFSHLISWFILASGFTKKHVFLKADEYFPNDDVECDKLLLAMMVQNTKTSL